MPIRSGEVHRSGRSPTHLKLTNWALLRELQIGSWRVNRQVTRAVLVIATESYGFRAVAPPWPQVVNLAHWGGLMAPIEMLRPIGLSLAAATMVELIAYRAPGSVHGKKPRWIFFFIKYP